MYMSDIDIYLANTQYIVQVHVHDAYMYVHNHIMLLLNIILVYTMY